MISDFPNEWPDMIQVCLYTGGQRLGDIAKLKWEQIDLEGGRISMTSEKTKRRMNKPVIEQLKEILQRRHEKKSMITSSLCRPCATHKQATQASSHGTSLSCYANMD